VRLGSVALAAALLGCGGKVEQAAPQPTPDAQVAEDTSVPIPPAEVGVVEDVGPTKCGCCAAPFMARMSDWTSAVIATGAGEVIVAGNLIDKTTSALGPVWLSRIGDNGLPYWKRTYDGELGTVTSLVETSAGFALLRKRGSGTYGAYVIATDAEGNRRWAKQLGVAVDARGDALVATSKGLIVVGSFEESSPSFRYRGWIARLDLDGTMRSETVEDGLLWTHASAIQGGNVAMCGHGDGSTTCAMETDAGTPLWRRKLPLDWAMSKIAVAPDGGLFVAGTKQDLTAPLPNGGFASHLWVAKLDAKGELVWQRERRLPARGYISVQALVATPDGGLALNGYTDEGRIFGEKPPSDVVMWRWYVARYDATGTTSWAKGYAPTGPNGGQGRGVAACKEGLILLGATYPDAESRILRTTADGVAPIPPPGSTIDL